ncbi:hypothetical protein [Thiopseudomonas acetoxidans]|uniref:Uncharacterized protein n=1 Tax=Thiopseudomonas acetoxidans TaxID=3041622 RepID=A0ABT7STH9_9GAMM|nr:hypothetical protein [Thiopseudomonas sp. CY1220]MDM7858872.1 hypothetical protein [Thiopseudomonas sp. CY1220]
MKGVVGRVCAMMTALAGVVGVVNDLISPILALAGYALAAVGVILSASVIVACVPPLGRALRNIPAPGVVRQFFSDYWAAPFIIGQLLFGAVLLGSHYATLQSADSGGVVATVFPVVKDWQEKLGAIEVSAAKIEENTGRSAVAAESLDKKADNFKREVSEDPQKELMNRGVAWTDQSFGQALMRSDVKVVELFVRAGWNIRSAFNPEDGGSAIGYYAFLGDTSDKVAVGKIVDLLTSRGLSMREPVARFRGVTALSLPAAAASGCNRVLLEVLLEKGARASDVRSELKSAWNGYISAPDDSPHYAPCTQDKARIEKLLGL